MDFGVTDEVLFVGGRERAADLARPLDDCLVRWATSPAAAVALIEGQDRQFDCIVADVDDTTAFEVARARWPDVVCLSVAGNGPDDGEQVTEEELVQRVAGAVTGADDLGYPVTPAEADRLEAVDTYLREQVLDADAFDRLAGLARRLLEADVGLVGLLDQQQEHIVGKDGDFPERLSREKTICTHTILGDEPVVVEDVARDPRFEDNEVLADLGIRAYAGVPIYGRMGERIGSLCVTDCFPRAFADGDVEQLAQLAAEVTDQFELRRRVAADQGVA